MNTDEEIKAIRSHIDKGNYHAGINLAISAMNACRKNEDQAGVDVFLGVIQSIVNTMRDEFGSQDIS